MRRWDPSLLGDGEQADGDAYPMDVGSGPLSDNDDDDDGTACASASPNGVPAPVRRSGQWGLCGFRVPNVKFAVMCVYSVWSLAVCCFAPLSLSCFRATAPGEWLDQRSLDPVSCFMLHGSGAFVARGCRPRSFAGAAGPGWARRRRCLCTTRVATGASTVDPPGGDSVG